MKHSPLKRGSKTLKRTPFKIRVTTQGVVGLKTHPRARRGIKKIGKVGTANLEANRRLKVLFSDITSCEMKLKGCLGPWPLQRAHRHKRIWYKGDVDKLSDYKQVVIACQWCHELTENNRPLNDRVFMKLRGPE